MVARSQKEHLSTNHVVCAGHRVHDYDREVGEAGTNQIEKKSLFSGTSGGNPRQKTDTNSLIVLGVPLDGQQLDDGLYKFS